MAWSKSTRISVMLAIDTAFFLVELISGFLVGSLALTADAFHMLNDIISLLVGLWAVSVARKATTDKYSYGWLRAEILGAFFNAVFLIALCVSIILDALTRFVDPPTIGSPQLILIVGSLGLASNLVGFVVLGGHGHGHGHGHNGEHEHEHEDGHGHGHMHDRDEDRYTRDRYETGREHTGDRGLTSAEEGRAGIPPPVKGRAVDILPEAVIAKIQPGAVSSRGAVRHIQFRSASTSPSAPVGRSDSRKAASRGQERRRASSVKHSRLTSIEDLSIHPASFRQDIIEHRWFNVDENSGSSAEDEAAETNEASSDENTPLLNAKGNGKDRETSTSNGDQRNFERNGMHYSRSRSRRFRRDSIDHEEHHHTNPGKSSTRSHGHGHNHADMGMNAMVLHVLGDALGNLGVIVTALVIWLTDWPGRYYADPAVSLFITLIILRSALPLTFATSKILLQATPDNIDPRHIKEDIQRLPGVVSCHHVHIWQLSDTKLVASMHIQVTFPVTGDGGEKYMRLAKQARKCLHAYGIHSATIQPEFCLDERCNHAGDSPTTTLNGQIDGCSTPRCGAGETSQCLLECVDDCIGQGCCSALPSQSESPVLQTSHSGHDHEHDTGHDHSHH